MKNTSFKVEDVISKDKFSQEQITKLNIFLAKYCNYKFYYKNEFFQT